MGGRGWKAAGERKRGKQERGKVRVHDRRCARGRNNEGNLAVEDGDGKSSKGLRVFERKAPARFHGHRVYTPPLSRNTNEGGLHVPFQRTCVPPFSHSISFCHCSFSAAWRPGGRHSERDLSSGTATLCSGAPFSFLLGVLGLLSRVLSDFCSVAFSRRLMPRGHASRLMIAP